MAHKIERLPIFQIIEEMALPETRWPEIIDPKWELAQFAGAVRASLLNRVDTLKGRESRFRAKEKRRLLEGLSLGQQAVSLEWKIISEWDQHNQT